MFQRDWAVLSFWLAVVRVKGGLSIAILTNFISCFDASMLDVSDIQSDT